MRYSGKQKDTYMPTPIEVVQEAFSDNEWEFTPDPEHSGLKSRFDGDYGEIAFAIRAKGGENLCITSSTCPLRCPADRRKQLCEVLNHINYGLMLGNFEMDHRSGRIHFRTAAPFSDERLDKEVVAALVRCNLGVVNEFLPFIMSVAYGNVTPRRAMEQIARSMQETADRTDKPKTPRDRRSHMNN